MKVLVEASILHRFYIEVDDDCTLEQVQDQAWEATCERISLDVEYESN